MDNFKESVDCLIPAAKWTSFRKFTVNADEPETKVEKKDCGFSIDHGKQHAQFSTGFTSQVIFRACFTTNYQQSLG